MTVRQTAFPFGVFCNVKHTARQKKVPSARQRGREKRDGHSATIVRDERPQPTDMPSTFKVELKQLFDVDGIIAPTWGSCHGQNITKVGRR
jgi:hypothetical protein